MPNLVFEFSKFDIIAAIIPGTIVLFGVVAPFAAIIFSGVNDAFESTGFAYFLLTLMAIVFSFFVGKLMSQLSYWIIEKGFVIPKEKRGKEIKWKLGYPSFHLLGEKPKAKEKEEGKEEEETNNHRCFKNYRKPIPGKLPGEFRDAYKAVFGRELEKKYYFPIVYTYVKEHCSECSARLVSFSALYHFFRNLTLTFFPIVIFMIICYSIIINSWVLGLLASVISIILAYICFKSYLKYFRVFSSEVINSFYVYYIETRGKKTVKTIHSLIDESNNLHRS